MGVTVYVHDSMRGCPAEGMPVMLEKQTHAKWIEAGTGLTDDNGHVGAHFLHVEGRGVYRLILDLDSYFVSLGVESFYPSVTTTFRLGDGVESICLLFFIAAHSYSSYRVLFP